MVSKNNLKWKQQRDAQRVPHYGLRKLSVGVASVLLSTTLYMGATAHADTVAETNPQPTTDQPASTAAGTSTGSVTADAHAQPTADQPANAAANNSVSENDAFVKPVSADVSKQSANVVDTQPVSTMSGTQSATAVSGNQSAAATNNTASASDVNTDSAPAMLPKQPANTADTQPAETANHVSPFINLAVISTDKDLTPKRETVDSKWTLHYVDHADHTQELKAPTVITRQYTRTNISRNDGTTQYGDWSYVPGSFKQTGTPITVRDSDSPVKEDNVFNADKMENMDGFTVIAMYPTIEDYTTHDGIGGVRLTDWLGNSDRQAASLTDNFYAEYDEHKERSIAVKFVDDQHDGQQVGQATAVTGRDGDTVDLKLTVPDKYQLADRQKLPTSYTFEKGSGDLEVHLVHQVVQREATADVQMRLIAAVRIDDGDLPFAVTQNQWTQLDDKIRDYGQPDDRMYPLVKVGTLTGHVNYDLVDNRVVSFGDDWTTLSLGGQTYQMPNGTEVVNGIMIDYYPGALGKSIKEELLKYHPDTDPDYTNRPWHGYLSVNTTNNWLSNYIGDSSLQAGLVGNEPNTMAKANGDQAATAIKSANKTVDLSLLQRFNFETRDFSEQNGQLQGIADLEVAGVYIPYVEKTATRTINVTTPDGKTTAVKQTATLAKQVDFSKDAHPAWTTSEWTNYDVPTIPGYTASQSQVAKEAVTGETKDQTVNVTYAANDQSTHVNYVDAQGKTIHTTTVNGKTGQTVKVSSEIPDGWKLVDGQTVPNEITFGPDGHADMSVKIEHRQVTVTPDHPQANGTKLPDNPAKTFNGMEANDLNKTITRTIKVTTPDGQTKTVTQDAKLTRTATVDEVTGEVTYGKWTTGKWSNYNVPAVPGYTASQSEVPAAEVTSDTTDQTISISYTANDQTTHINYVDGNGKIVHTTAVTGKTDQTVKVPNEVPTGWTITDGQVPSEITFGANGHDDATVTVGHHHATVTPDKPQTDGMKLPDNPSKTFHGVSETDLNKVVTRTIEIASPARKTTTVKQTAKLTRTADIDEVTGEVTYGKWTTGAWSSYTVPTVPGYTASQVTVPATAVTAETEDQTVAITHAADSHATHINYVDENGNVVHTTTVTGQTDQTVKVPNETPAGWTIATGKVPSEVTFGANGYDNVNVTVSHETVTVTPDQPQTDGTQLPDNPALIFRGVGADDLNRTVTREITLSVPGQDPQVVTQTAHLTRTATVDEVTGEVTYSDWTTGHWDAYEVPAVDGYTTDQKMIPAVDVTSETTSQEIAIDYTAMPEETPTEPSNKQSNATQAPSKTPTAQEQAPTAKAQAPVQAPVKAPAAKVQASTAKAKVPQAPAAQQLPQTGESHNNVLAPIGAVLLELLGGFGLFAKKRKKDEHEKL